MIKTEILENGRLIRHYSDMPNMGLLQVDTGVEYAEAVDVNPTNHVYEEIPMEGNNSDIEDREIADAVRKIL